eukprot:scaffold2.g6981.t1
MQARHVLPSRCCFSCVASLPLPQGEDDGSAQLLVGVYAIYSAERHLQYVGYSRNVALAVKAHLARVGEERCAYVRAMVFANRAMQSRAALLRETGNWLEEAGTIPPGGFSRETRRQDAVGRAGGKGTAGREQCWGNRVHSEYEEKKLKMQKAMGEAPAPSPGDRRAATLAAVEGGDWSAVIDAQTKATLPPSSPGGDADAAPPGPRQAGGQVVTPFTRPLVHRAVGASAGGGAPLEMTRESVDRVLDDVGGGQDPPASAAAVDLHLNMLRGAVAAYDGSVDVVSVENGVCTLNYEGPKPLAYGLQAAVKDKWPDLRSVVVLDKGSGEPLRF